MHYIDHIPSHTPLFLPGPPHLPTHPISGFLSLYLLKQKRKKGKEKKIKMNKKPVRQNIQNKVGSVLRACRRAWAWGLPRGMADVLSDVPAEET